MLEFDCGICDVNDQLAISVVSVMIVGLNGNQIACGGATDAAVT